MPEIENLENRVLVLMPTGRDADLVCRMLEKSEIHAECCADARIIEEMLAAGAGALLLAEEALVKDDTLEHLVGMLNRQPVWSDLPVVLFASNGRNAERLLELVGARINATIVERPIRITMLVSAVRGALRARERQYQSRNLQNQLEESDRQKDLFLATLSHELRTPLNSILGWIQLINGEDSSRHVNVKHALSVIERNARAQAEMISDILFVSRIITGKLKLNLQTINVNSVVQNALDILRPALDAKEIRLNATFDADAPPITGDADRLQQVFWNLLSNAVKFTEPKKTITVRVTSEEAAVRVEIADSGQGIKPEFLPYVFERFRQADNSYTRQFGGLGLGLAIVHHLVELHQGAVRVESAGENQGATFIVTLPVSAQINSEPETNVSESLPPIAAEKSARGIHVLLIEDDEDSREMLKVMFEQHQIEITAVASAAEAVPMLEAIRPDVLISDIGLPNEDGYELIRRVRKLPAEQGGETPAIALTGYASLQDRNLAFDVGYQKHLSKPVDIDKLLELVKELAKSED